MTAPTIVAPSTSDGKHHWSKLGGWSTYASLWHIVGRDEGEPYSVRRYATPGRRLDRRATGGVLFMAEDRTQGVLLMLRNLTAEQEEQVLENAEWMLTSDPLAYWPGIALFSRELGGWVYHVPKAQSVIPEHLRD